MSTYASPQAYREAAVLTASPVQLVVMLYDGVERFLRQAEVVMGEGNVAQALRPYPQYQLINWRAWPIGNSIYHSLQVKVDKRFTSGSLFRVFYTRSKLINNGAENGQNGGDGGNPQNPINTVKLERTVSADDVPNTFVFSYSYQLPFGRNMSHGFVRYLISGWTLNGLLRYESPRPLRITMNNDLSGILFNGLKRPNVVSNANPEPINRSDFDPNRDRYLNKAAWSDPGPLQFGNTPREDAHIRGFARVKIGEE